MKHVLDQEAASHPPAVPPVVSFIRGAMYVLIRALIVLALFAGGVLLLNDLASQVFVFLPQVPLSAAPLLLVGTASLGFQTLTRPKPRELFKALLVSLAFILWGVDQMLSPGRLATTLGDVVIVLYVVDLGWLMGSVLHTQKADILSRF